MPCEPVISFPAFPRRQAGPLHLARPDCASSPACGETVRGGAQVRAPGVRRRVRGVCSSLSDFPGESVDAETIPCGRRRMSRRPRERRHWRGDATDLFRAQVVVREAEQRAYDLFLQNLVKGTSHLSLGQEAIAAGFASAMKPGDLSFCTYRGHAHTLARGVPVEKVLGELMQRDNGLMRGKGGSMHLTSVDHGVMGSYAIIGAHLPIACGAAWRAQYKGQKDVSVCF